MFPAGGCAIVLVTVLLLPVAVTVTEPVNPLGTSTLKLISVSKISFELTIIDAVAKVFKPVSWAINPV